ncbi:odorant-binding protein-like [Cervus canadensis]|uniref:odorant-binding protein-like n=1 Tax=Cervus canadensis TaxID=1574408 RepID=UPI001CA36CC5|nr:odorant-binding protein-like [Cervus canadensis]
MKVLLFSFVLGLLVASQGEAQTDASQLTGRWKSHYTAADNIEKITEGGPFHTFLRYMKFDEENGTALFQFYFKEDGECRGDYTTGTKDGDVYSFQCKYECFTGNSEMVELELKEIIVISTIKAASIQSNGAAG